MKLLHTIFLSIVTSLSASILYAVECPDIQKLMSLATELSHSIDQDFCTHEINGQHLDWIKNSAFPQIMNKSFLGVEPPSNWRMVLDDLMQCYTQGNLCSKKVQEEFAQCTMAKMPIILFQLSPWFSEHCVKMNATVLQGWPVKKSIIMGLINEFTQRHKRNGFGT
ncbi:hypothetical protein [Legionella quateirensis]|uniref:Uncharacterized protein n=1 Tax=Legionella quateirensis TaxID=45072 RepID=A0A378KPX1_9GAMM|nr:hypothetical protein [Legionella quateirensis]KTD55428.1 hypothetical protein Lqua_0145 [Legionella quateirensis]STY16602.1 Uncharacterised protein [Legionella quateirensis]